MDTLRQADMPPHQHTRRSCGGGSWSALTLAAPVSSWTGSPSSAGAFGGCSAEMTITADIEDAIGKVPSKRQRRPMTAKGSRGTGRGWPRLPALLELFAWPKGMRVIARKGPALSWRAAADHRH